MEKHLLSLVAGCLLSVSCVAQWVNIPDANFRVWLNAHGYSQCMNGNLLDTTCTAVMNTTSINVDAQSIYDLTGITYFDSLQSLLCRHNPVTSLPPLPKLLRHLDCSQDFNLTSLPPLPSKLDYLSTRANKLLTSLPSLPDSLLELWCSVNNLSSLPTLPNSLLTLRCGFNPLINLPPLPPNLNFLECDSNQLSTLPPLPNTLMHIHCQYNNLVYLPSLPNSLRILHCYNNQLASLPVLPDSIIMVVCGYNQITELNDFPDSIDLFWINDNPISCFPLLKTISNLKFTNTNISCLPNYGNVAISNPLFSSLPLCDTTNYTTYCNAGFNPIPSLSTPNSTFSIYPNPTLDAITLSVPENLIGETAVVTDITGKQMAAVQLATVNQQLSTDSWSSGVYLVRVGNAVRKLIVQK